MNLFRNGAAAFGRSFESDRKIAGDVRSRLQHLMPVEMLGKPKRTNGTRDMIDLMLAHAARAKRMSKPRVKTAIRVFGPSGKEVVKLKIRLANQA